MLQKNNRPPPKKKARYAAEFDFEALIREHKKTEWGKQPTTFLSKLLMTPEQLDAYHKDRALQLERLFEKYGVDLNSGHIWRDLALALARRYEPGFSSRKSGSPKKHDDDVELIFIIELLRCRDGMSIPEACKAIAEKGVIKGKPKTLQSRYKELKRHGWKGIVRGFDILKANVGADRYLKFYRRWLGGESSSIIPPQSFSSMLTPRAKKRGVNVKYKRSIRRLRPRPCASCCRGR